MATITDYFNIDQNHNLKITSENKLEKSNGDVIPYKIFQDLASGSFYFAFFLPEVEKPLEYCRSMLQGNAIEIARKAVPLLVLKSQRPETVPIDTNTLQFCGRVYIYSNNHMSKDDVNKLFEESKKLGLYVQYFGPEWAEERSALEKPLAFISYDSQDRELIARPLALKLAGLGVPVWFDEFSLKVGDSLREKIEHGLKETKKCILIVTTHFLSNEGWTKTEFNSVFTREILEESSVILPVWDKVTVKEVYEYSPSLSNKMALKWEEGVEVIAKKLSNVIKDSG